MEERVGIPSEYLLKGAWYAFEQCGRLLQHAVILHENKAHSSAVALAMFAREELGKGRIFLDLWRDVEERGRAVEMMEVRAACEDHERKQRKAQLSVTLRAEGPGGLARLVWARMKTKPQSPEYRAAAQELDKVTQTLAKRAPADRHATRQRALYVDPDEAGTDWNRPVAMSADEANNLLVDAANDYAGHHDRLRPEMLRAQDPALAAALEAWPDRPALPPPKWPEFA